MTKLGEPQKKKVRLEVFCEVLSCPALLGSYISDEEKTVKIGRWRLVGTGWLKMWSCAFP